MMCYNNIILKQINFLIFEEVNIMTEKQAMEKGFQFTGNYERWKEKLVDKLNELKKDGYKCTIVTVPDSQYSRGPRGCGYSIYAERKYYVDERRRELQDSLNRIESRKARAWEKYAQTLSEIENDKLELEEELEKLKVERV
jgi:hypothetical protein